jgi:DNA-binding transcriptional MerR regulator
MFVRNSSGLLSRPVPILHIITAQSEQDNMQKQMFRIGDFSLMGQVSIRTLRHYDAIGLLKPAYIDRFTDYRYYTLEQLPQLNRILALKDLGFSLDQIKHLLDDNLPASQIQGILQLKQAELEQQVQNEQARLHRVTARLKMIEQEGKVSPYEVILKSTRSQTIVSARAIVPTIAEMVTLRCALLRDVYAWLTHCSVNQCSPEFTLYHIAEYREQDIDIEMAVGIDPISLSATSTKTLTPHTPPASLTTLTAPNNVTVRTLPAVQTMASVIHRGSLHEVGRAITALLTWINANGYLPDGALREIHLFGREDDENIDLDNIVLEMQIPLTRST